MDINALVDGGKATAGPPLGPVLGPLGVNIVGVVNLINERTKNFEGMKVPVRIHVDEKTKEFTITVGTPPVSALIFKELSVEKGTSGEEPIGNLTLAQIIKIANSKPELLGNTLKRRAKEIIGSCLSLGVTVEDKPPREIQRLIDEGKYDDALEETSEPLQGT